MDLNYLLSRHQISLMRAGQASGCEARIAHEGLATCYADNIRRLQQRLGASSSLPCAA